MRVLIVEGDVVTSYGRGLDVLWAGLLSGRTAIRPISRFPTGNFQTCHAATVDDVDPAEPESMVMQMLRPMIARSSSSIPRDAQLILASTVGEIEFLQREVETGGHGAVRSCLRFLQRTLERAWGLEGDGITLSAACASSTTAIAHGAGLIWSGECDAVLVVACDAVSEFVFAGFSSLLALDPLIARPFDRHRAGLTLGEAAGYVLLMSEHRAVREGRQVMGEVCGWGLTSDAVHMTGPLRDGSGLARAIEKALARAEMEPSRIGSIAAHGTGTLYNDAMEIRAFKAVRGLHAVPTYSIKGGTGHTLGAAGLVETLVAIRSARERLAPPSVNLLECDDEASGWVHRDAQPLRSALVVSTNSGFGGINAALVLSG